MSLTLMATFITLAEVYNYMAIPHLSKHSHNNGLLIDKAVNVLVADCGS